MLRKNILGDPLSNNFNSIAGNLIYRRGKKFIAAIRPDNPIDFISPCLLSSTIIKD